LNQSNNVWNLARKLEKKKEKLSEIDMYAIIDDFENKNIKLDMRDLHFPKS
jgi:hypothetical protein